MQFLEGSFRHNKTGAGVLLLFASTLKTKKKNPKQLNNQKDLNIIGVNFVKEQAVKDINSYEVLFYKLIIWDCSLFYDASVPDRSRSP